MALIKVSQEVDKAHGSPTEATAILSQQTNKTMSIIYFMIGISLLMALGFLGAFFWSMKTGQQDDLYTPSLRMLLEDSVSDETSSQLVKPEPIRRTTSPKAATAI